MDYRPPVMKLAPGLQLLRQQRSAGVLSLETRFQPGVSLHADPDLCVSGKWGSPAGRMLELSATMLEQGQWMGLHVQLDMPDVSQMNWFGFLCRGAAPAQIMLRACLRSATEEGFQDDFFPRHLLMHPTPENHVDALHLATVRSMPSQAAWRELILFLPCQSFQLHLHDLEVFAA